jgi:hypothetical protein
MTRIGGEQSVEGLLLDWSLAAPLLDRRLPVGLLSREQKAAELQRVPARRAMDAAYEAELVMGLADDTPDTLDPPPGHPGARRGSWAPDAELPRGVGVLHQPAAAQSAFIEVRDRTCRFPDCGQRVAGPTTTTSSRTPAAGRPTARTSAASAAATTGSRPSPAAGGSSWTPTAPCT